MKREYAGVEVDLGKTSWIAWEGWDSAIPVFHAWAPPRGRRTRSRCGLDLSACSYVPVRFAVRIGRPCLTCWPQLRPQRSLFDRPRRRAQADAPQEAMPV